MMNSRSSHLFQAKHDPETARRIADYMDALMGNLRKLTRQEFKTLRGQALAGDVDGAWKGLNRLLVARR